MSHSNPKVYTLHNGQRQLVRAYEARMPGGTMRQQTVIFTELEWEKIQQAVLAEHGLVTEAEARRRLGVAYEETERMVERNARLERELHYAATGEELEDAG